jgi:predicted P-loop ATPase
MPILEGAQGIGKTRGIEALAGQEWYADVDATMGSREFIEQIQGKWVVEISELSAMRAGDVEKVKTTLTKTVDVYREPYSTFATDHPRQCVFIGSTNADAYLLDDSGNRRFLPIECSRVDRQWIRENRLQLIAEAVAAFKDGQTWWDIPVDLAKTEQAKREFEDSLVDRIRDYAIFHENINIAEMLNAWQISPDRQTVAFQRRISSCLRRLGYTRNKSGGLIIWRLEALTLPPRSGAVTPIRRAKVID